MVEKAGWRVKVNGRWRYYDVPASIRFAIKSFFAVENELKIWWSYQEFRLVLAALVLGSAALYAPWASFWLTRGAQLQTCAEIEHSRLNSNRYGCKVGQDCSVEYAIHTNVTDLGWQGALTSCPGEIPVRPDLKAYRVAAAKWTEWHDSVNFLDYQPEPETEEKDSFPQEVEFAESP